MSIHRASLKVDLTRVQVVIESPAMVARSIFHFYDPTMNHFQTQTTTYANADNAEDADVRVLAAR